MATDTMGKKMPDTIKIQIRPDSPTGVSIGGGKDLAPGEVADVPFSVAIRLLNSGRATRVKSAPDDLQTRDPAPKKEKK
jgi:hypothetical protein